MKKFLKIALLCFCFSGTLIFAESTPIENLYSRRLKNGLSVFVAENHTVPLAYIEIAVRAGGISQVPENSGLFHFYEHMMFKGNKKFRTSEEIQNALTDLGVANWNGSTSMEYVNYFFTVPSDKIEEGLDFWNQAIRNPLMDKRELEDEKQVVLSEITANSSDPSYIASYDYRKRIYHEAPWLSDPSGNPDNIRNATVAQLKKIQKQYYIPNNCALFVGGDVNPEEVFKMVEKYYGSWKKGKDPWAKEIRQLDKDPFKKEDGTPVYRVVPNDKVSPSYAIVDIDWRGPDAAFDVEDTYAADVLLTLVQDPSGFYKQGLLQNRSLGIPRADYTSFSYLTRKYLGAITAESVMMNPEVAIGERVEILLEQIPSLLHEMIPDDSPLSVEQLSIVRQKILNDRIYEQETATSLLSSLRFWWTCCDEEYFYTYSDNLHKIGSSEIEKFLEKYINTKTPLVTLHVNKDLYYETLKDELPGYIEVNQEDAYWFNKKGE